MSGRMICEMYTFGISSWTSAERTARRLGRRMGCAAPWIFLLALALAGTAHAAAPPTRGGTSVAAAPPGLVAGSISSGSYHSCAIRTDGTLACWGLNNYGQATPPAGIFIDIAGGSLNTCGISRVAHSSAGAT